MKNAEQRLRIKHEIQARKDKANPEFDPNVQIKYNPRWEEKGDSDDDDNEDQQNEQKNINFDNDDEEDNNSDDRIHLTDDGIDKIKSLMLDMPKLNNVPDWANKIPEDIWKNKLLDTLQQKDHINKKDDIVVDKIVVDDNCDSKQNIKSVKDTKPEKQQDSKGKNQGKVKNNKNNNKSRGKGKSKHKSNKNNKNNKNKTRGGGKHKNSKHKSKKPKK